MITMNTKFLMAGMVLAIMILTTTGAALDAPFNAAFSTVYGQVTDNGAGVNGVYVSLSANGMTITTVTMTNNRGENGFYIFEVANIPKVTDTTPLTLSVTTATGTATTTITKSGGNLQKVDLAVQALQAPVLTTITVNPATKSVIEGATWNFIAVTHDQFHAPIDAAVTWSSSNQTVGTINAAGVFTAKVAGTTMITAANGSVSGTATVTVISATPALARITITPEIALVPVGDARNFVAATLDQFGNTTAAAVTWSSSNTTVGTIDTSGLFRALADGTTTITAASGTISATATATVIAPVLTTITVTPDNAAIVLNGTRAFTATASDQFGAPMAGITLSWSTSNPTVGTVTPPSAITGADGNASATFTALAKGTATITARNGSVVGSAAVAVTVTGDKVFDLKRGWNLISIPAFADSSSVRDALANVQYNGIVGYDPATGTFATPASLQPLHGYWINVTVDNQAIAFVASRDAILAPPSRSLYEGWNLIGVSANRSDPAGMTAGVLFVDLKQGPDPTQWLYTRLVSYDMSPPTTYVTGANLNDATVLNQGHGYWLFIKNIPNTDQNNVPWAGRTW